MSNFYSIGTMASPSATSSPITIGSGREIASFNGTVEDIMFEYLHKLCGDKELNVENLIKQNGNSINTSALQVPSYFSISALAASSGNSGIPMNQLDNLV